jgi:flavorubredoxin
MRALVVYESMFGNTQQIARAIADGLGERLDVHLAEVGHAPVEVGPETTLLVVGGPTHALGLSNAKTRESAAQQALVGVVSQGIGIREWLATMHVDAEHTVTAAFDTRINKRWVPGSASAKVHRALQRKGLRSATKARSFYVSGTSGPLLRGEVERARAWGALLASELVSAHPSIPHG